MIYKLNSKNIVEIESIIFNLILIFLDNINLSTYYNMSKLFYIDHNFNIFCYICYKYATKSMHDRTGYVP